MNSAPSRAVDHSTSPHIALAGLAALLTAFDSASRGFAPALPDGLASRLLSLCGAGFSMLVVLAGYSLARVWLRGEATARTRVGQLSWFLFLPYLCSLLGTLVLFVAAPSMTSPELMGGTLLADTSRAFSPGSLVSHVLSLQNLFPRWQGRVNPLLSPLAAAGQGALLLALLYWPLARRYGALRALPVPLLLALPPLLSARAAAAGTWLCALPALGAWVSLQRADAQSSRLPSREIAAALALLYVVARLAGLPAFVCDLLSGAATACVLLTSSPLLSNLSRSRFLHVVARHAYALFLLHVPVLGLVYVALSRLGLQGWARGAALIVVGVPASVLVAAGFFHALERRLRAGMPSLATTARVVGRAVAAVVALVLIALITEYALQRADREALSKGQTFATLDGRKVRYKLEGQSSSAPLVVFNSSVHSLEEWGRVASFVSRFARTLRFDRCGMGLSDAFPQPCTPEASVDELNKLLDSLGEKQPVIVVGYSISGVSTRAFLAHRPERLAAAVLVDPFMPETDQPGLPGSEETQHFFRVMLPLDVVKASLGLTRLRAALSPVTQDGYGKGSAWQRVQLGSKHAYSVWRQGERFSRTAVEDLARDKAADVPVVMLSGAVDGTIGARIQQDWVRGLKRGQWQPIIGVRHELLVRYAEPDGPIVQTLKQLVEQAQRKLVDSGSAP